MGLELQMNPLFYIFVQRRISKDRMLTLVAFPG
jgi:hypothetical protein